MRYIISLTVVFEPENKLLMLENNDLLTIELSLPTTRLLIELIKNNHQEVARELLIKNAWEDYGYTSSDSNLNNSISELRKAFSALGLDKDIIVTIPKFGFSLNADIYPELISLVKSEPISYDSTLPDSIPPQNVEQVKSVNIRMKFIKFFFRKRVKYFLGGVYIFLIAILIYQILGESNNIKPLLVKTQGKCDFYSLDGDRVDYYDEITTFLKNESVDCKIEEKDIYYSAFRLNNDLTRSHFLSVCTRKGMGYRNCNNYKLREQQQ